MQVPISPRVRELLIEVLLVSGRLLRRVDPEICADRVCLHQFTLLCGSADRCISCGIFVLR